MESKELRAANTLHEVRDTAKLEALTASMVDDGWIGRPVLVLDCGDYHQAFTGSHRIPAAIEARIMIDSLVIETDEWTQELEDDWVYANDDYERMTVLRDHGLDEAANLMAEEIAQNRSEAAQ